VLISDANLYKSVCPFEGARLSRAKKFAKGQLTSKTTDSVSIEIVAQATFWKGIHTYVRTFSTSQDRVAQQPAITKEVQSRYKTFYDARIKAAEGAGLRTIVNSRITADDYNNRITRLMNSVIIIGLSRFCLCNRFLRAQYKPNAPQVAKDTQWQQGTAVLNAWIGQCQNLVSATSLCKSYSVSSQDLSCAVLPDTKGCLPIFEKLYEDTLAPLKPKLPTGKFAGVADRVQLPKVPQWLIDANNQLTSDKLKKGPISPPIVQPLVAQPTQQKAPAPPSPPTLPAKIITPPTKPPVVQQTPVQPQQPQTPPPPPPPAQKPATPQQQQPVKPALSPLVIPKVPKKVKTQTPAPSTPTQQNQQTKQPSQPAQPSQPTQPKTQTPPPKVPLGPSVYVGAKKKITIFDQK